MSNSATAPDRAPPLSFLPGALDDTPDQFRPRRLGIQLRALAVDPSQKIRIHSNADERRPDTGPAT